MMVLDMFFEEYCPGKGFATEVTFLGLTFMMVLDMFFEEYFPGKGFATNVTFVRFLSSMHLHVVL